MTPILKRRKKLKDKLSAEQLTARNEKVQDRATFRNEISTEHAKTRGLAVEAFNRTQFLANHIRRGYIFDGLLALALALTLGRVLGLY